jgi:LacI family transcriptional regulator
LGYNVERLHGQTPGNKTIGVVFPELRSLYYNKIYDTFCKRMEEEGFRIVTLLYNFDGVDKQLEDVRFMLKQNFAGILFLTESLFDVERLRMQFRTTQTKIVMITYNNLINFCDTISTNHALSVQLAVDHLCALGHKNIAYIGEPHTRYKKGEFIASIKRHDLPLNENFIIEVNHRFEECGYIGMKKLLALDEMPTACFVAYDNIAYGALRALKEAGLSCPKDISLLGIDNNPMSKYMIPSISSVNLPETDIGKTAADFLVERINGVRSAFRSVLICPTIYDRESTKEIKSDNNL